MDGILSTLQTVTSNNKNLPIFVCAYDNHQSISSNSQGVSSTSNDVIIQHITSIMSRPATRFQAFYVLTNIFPQLPIEVIEQKGVLWTTLTIKVISQKGSDDVVPLAFRFLRLLIGKSVHIPELSKTFSTTFIVKFGETLSEASPAGHLDCLKTIETCLRVYSGPCGSARGHFEKFVLRFVDSTDKNLVIWSGKCLHLLQQVRGGGVQGISHKVAWEFYNSMLIGSLHKLLDFIFANCTEFYDEPVEKTQLKIDSLELSTEPIQKAVQLVTRFKNLVAYLIIALREPFPVTKTIMPKKILNLIFRGLAINCKMLEKNAISDNLAIGALLPSFHVELFKLVDALILTAKTHLAQHYKLILGFVYDTLKWTTSKKSAGRQKPYLQLRIAAYNTLSLWCATMKFGSCVEVISEGIIEQIDFDITPFQNEFTLKVLSGAKKHMSKKARKQLHKTQNEQSNLAQNHAKCGEGHATKIIFSDEGNQALCCSALRCLKFLLVSSSCFLKPTVIKDIHNNVINLCLHLHENRSSKEKLYSNYICRLGLYDVLQNIIVSTNNLCPPPTQIALKMLSIAQISDSHPAVRECCWNYLKYLEKIIHPQKECLLFPPDIREIKNAFSKFGRPLITVSAQSNNQETVKEDSDEDNAEDNDEDSGEDSGEDIDEEDGDGHDNEKQDDVIAGIDDIEEEKKTKENITTKGDSSEKVMEIEERINLTNSSENVTQSLKNHQGDDNVIGFVDPKLSSVHDAFEYPDSPEITLHVDEDDDYLPHVNLKSDGDEPAAKKAKIVGENIEGKTLGNDKNDSFYKNDDDVLLAELAAKFVDELN